MSLFTSIHTFTYRKFIVRIKSGWNLKLRDKDFLPFNLANLEIHRYSLKKPLIIAYNCAKMLLYLILFTSVIKY